MKASSMHLILLMIPLLAIGTWAGAQGDQMQSQQTPAPQGDQMRYEPSPGTTQVQGKEPLRDQKETASAQPQSGPFQPNVMRATDLIGMKVVNRQNEDLGKVEEIVLNPERNKIAYGVLSFGGVLGIGDKHFAVPWDAFDKKPGATALILNKDKESLSKAPGFDKSNWPNMANPRWKEAVDKYYRTEKSDRQGAKDTEERTVAEGSTAETEEKLADRGEMKAETRQMLRQVFESRRLSELIGMTINNPQDQNLGDLEDVALDMREGRPVFGIIALSGDKMAPIPWSSLNIQPQTMTAQLDADPQTLQALAFEEGSFPNLSSREYASNVYSRFNREPYWSVYGYVSPGETQRQTGIEQSAKGWGPGTEYTKKFDPNTVSTVQGTVLSKGFFTPEKGAGPGERLRVRTDDGKTVIVHLGPRSHLESENISFQKGDKITITGSKAEIYGRNVIIATQVKKGDQTIQLRDDQGKPVWSSEGMGKSKGYMKGKEDK